MSKHSPLPQQQAHEVKRGLWLYDGRVRKGVVIQAINYDYWYELEKADGLDIGDESPALNAQGEMYIIRWMDASFRHHESFSVGGLELAETIALAESIVQQPIEWQSHKK